MQKKSVNRSDRVAAEVRRVLSEFFIHNSLGDEEIDTTFLSVTDVVLSSCLRHLKIYISSSSKDISSDDYIEFLKQHVPHLRHYIGTQIRLKFVPDLSFFIDDSFDYAKRIESLLGK
ncbi:MAG: 30S ribosome-binding factor RbfA [Holosporaceae bacterium]|jgi:ribosome-binding factor A|nr:30S ribosome-binding factor RbfA [Holosporaceae bacterium]